MMSMIMMMMMMMVMKIMIIVIMKIMMKVMKKMKMAYDKGDNYVHDEDNNHDDDEDHRYNENDNGDNENYDEEDSDGYDTDDNVGCGGVCFDYDNVQVVTIIQDDNLAYKPTTGNTRYLHIHFLVSGKYISNQISCPETVTAGKYDIHTITTYAVNKQYLYFFFLIHSQSTTLGVGGQINRTKVSQAAFQMGDKRGWCAV